MQSGIVLPHLHTSCMQSNAALDQMWTIMIFLMRTTMALRKGYKQSNSAHVVNRLNKRVLSLSLMIAVFPAYSYTIKGSASPDTLHYHVYQVLVDRYQFISPPINLPIDPRTKHL